MKTLYTVLWYLGVAVAAGLLIVSIFARNWWLSVAVLILALVLKYTNKYIPLPKIYREMGIDNDVFEGKTTRK